MDSHWRKITANKIGFNWRDWAIRLNCESFGFCGAICKSFWGSFSPCYAPAEMNGIDNPRDGSVQRIGWCELYFKLWCEELNISHNLKRYNSQEFQGRNTTLFYWRTYLSFNVQQKQLLHMADWWNDKINSPKAVHKYLFSFCWMFLENATNLRDLKGETV